MTEYTRPATWDDVKRLTGYLKDAAVRYALIGGYAIAAHGYVRFSEDVDILVDPAPDNTKRWIEALTRLPDAASKELVGQDDMEGMREKDRADAQVLRAGILRLSGTSTDR